MNGWMHGRTLLQQCIRRLHWRFASAKKNENYKVLATLASTTDWLADLRDWSPLPIGTNGDNPMWSRSDAHR